MAQPRTSTRKKAQVQPVSGPEKAFGQALREIRRERGLSQETMAFEGGFDRTYMSLLERGLQSPTLRTLFRLAGVLGVKASEIVARTETLMPKGRGQAGSSRTV